MQNLGLLVIGLLCLADEFPFVYCSRLIVKSINHDVVALYVDGGDGLSLMLILRLILRLILKLILRLTVASKTGEGGIEALTA